MRFSGVDRGMCGCEAVLRLYSLRGEVCLMKRIRTGLDGCIVKCVCW